MKRFTALVLAMCMVFSLCTMETHAHTDSEQSTADALNSLNLFQGVSTTETDYALDKELNRYEGYTLLIRMLGVEKEAAEGYQSGKYKYTFTDTIANWAKPYVAYAQSTGLTKGVDTAGKNFGGKSTLSEKMFLTMSLRALGYSDSGDNPDFQWNSVMEKAEEVGLVEESIVPSGNLEAGEIATGFIYSDGKLVPQYSDDLFTRGSTVTLFWTVLNTPMKNESTTLSEKLISEGVFTAEAFAIAKIIEEPVSKQEQKKDTDNDCYHKEIYSKVTVEPSCTTAGVLTYYCKDCIATIRKEKIDALGHKAEYKWDSEKHWKVCSVCGEKLTTVEKHQYNKDGVCTVCDYGCTHQYTNVVTAPDCTTRGYTTHTCKICNYVEIDSYTEALGHNYEVSDSKAAGCTTEGYITYTCSRCQHSKTETIPVTGHGKEVYKNDANGHWKVCSVCGDKLTTAAGHQYNKDGVCTVCGYGCTHQYTDVVTAPDCTTRGYTTHTCKICNHVEIDSYTEALGHHYEVSDSKAAGCTTEGYITYTCSECGDSYSETISATGHGASVYKSDVNDHWKVCSVCGEKLSAAAKHQFNKDSVCTVCGYKCTHQYTATVVAPTCTQQGNTLHVCKYCGDSYADTYTAAHGHSYVGTLTKAATCTETGTLSYTCKYCGDRSLGPKAIPALGHNYELVETVAATSTATGYKKYRCSRCPATYQTTLYWTGGSTEDTELPEDNF